MCLSAPEIAQITEPACNHEVIVITGEGLDPAKVQVKAACLGAEDWSFDPERLDTPQQHLDAILKRPRLPATPPERALECEVLAGGDHWLQVRMKCSRRPWVNVPATTAIWARDASGWSQPYLVNRPQAQWLSPATQAPGEVVRIFGRTFAWGHQLPAAEAFLRKVGSEQLVPLRRAAGHREDGHTERWCLSVWLPEELEPGRYEILVHGRHGGPYGWSDPLALEVAPEKPVTGPVVNVRDLGAKGDGLTDDADALAEAFKQAAGGRVVYLPAGVYALSRALEIPEQVILRGESMHKTILTNLEPSLRRPGQATDASRKLQAPALLHAMGCVTIQDLTIRFMPATAPALQIGRDMVWVEDVSLYRVRLEARQDYALAKGHDYTARPLVVFNARRLAMIRCETFGPGGVSCDRKLEDCQFSQNHFVTDRRWRGFGFKFWGAERCIFEDNILEGDTRGLVMQTHFGVNYRNFIAGNVVNRTVLGGNAGETYLVEGAGLLYESPVGAATSTSVTTTRWPEGHDETNPHRKTAGRFVVVANGRGLGQWRRIAAADPAAKTLTVDQPWRVVPDASSSVVVMNGLVETVFVNNQEIDCDKGLYLYYAGAINSIVDRHLCDRSLGVTLMTLDERQDANPAEHATAPDFFNLIRDCRIRDGGGIVVGAGGRMPTDAVAHQPLANFANRVIGNEVLGVRPWGGAQYGSHWRYGGGFSHLLAAINLIPMDLGRQPGSGLDGPARMTANVVQDNWIGQSPLGIGISKRAAGTLLYQNYFQWVPNLLVDHGKATKQIDSVVRGDEEYTPERGPVR